MINLTTSTYLFALQGQLPLGEALAGLTGLKTIDIREHHISGVGARGRVCRSSVIDYIIIVLLTPWWPQESAAYVLSVCSATL